MKYIIILVVVFSACQTAKKQEKVSIAEIKLLRQGAKSFTDAHTSNEFIVEGYFVKDPVPILVTDLKWVNINRPMPDSVFITLGGDALQQINSQLDSLQGAFIRLQGRVISPQENLVGYDSSNNKRVQFNIDFNGTRAPVIVRARATSFVRPSIYNICKLYPGICEIGSFRSTNYALLFSGGYNASNAHIRYWNDLKFMYKTLKSKYGYTDEQIVVVYKDGVPEDAEMQVDYAASPSGLNSAFAFLGTKLTNLSDLLFFTTNHGGGYHVENGANEGGVADGAIPDEIDSYKYDETHYYYNQADNTILDDAIAAKINALRFRTLIAVLEPCFSGGLLYDLRGSNRVVMSAASEFEYSWSGAPGNHDMFSYYFTCAINKATHTGAAVDADTNHDGKISMLEAFMYAKKHDTASESPQLEDTGDGRGTNSPAAIPGNDGFRANTVFL